MSDHVEIPLGDLIGSDLPDLPRADPNRVVPRGPSRIVKVVPYSPTCRIPCIWRSNKVVPAVTRGDGVERASYLCLLLVDPDQGITQPAYVEVEAWPNLPEGVVEW